jgi:hypothetical protein
MAHDDPRPPAPRVGRYSVGRAAGEVERHIQSAKKRGTHVRAAEALGISSQQLSHRIDGTYKFTIEELGILADHFRAPPGWPFIPWEEAEQRDEAWRTRRQRKPAPGGPVMRSKDKTR